MNFLKQFRNLVFVPMFLALGCSKTPVTSSTPSNNAAISPPTWIIGTWEQKLNGVVNTAYKFTSNDLITIVATNEISQKSTIDGYRTAGKSPKTTQEITNTLYSLTIDYGTGQSVNYTFNKKSTTVIVWSRAPTVNYVKK